MEKIMSFILILALPSMSIEKGYAELRRKYCGQNITGLPRSTMEKRDWLLQVKTKFDQHVAEGEKKNFIRLWWEQDGSLDPINFEYRITNNMTMCWYLIDKFKHNDRKIQCSDCGNLYLNPNFETEFKMKKSLQKESVFAINAPHFNIARADFVENFKQQNFTGVTFEPFFDGYYKMNIVQHQWNDRSGVCAVCGMKTNVIRTAFFNLYEEYLYDFQSVLTNCISDDSGDSINLDAQVVMSSRAMRFMYQYCDPFSNPVGETITPIMSGYLSDVIWPEDCMFYNGDYPLSVLRESWEKK
jgi:hypothetical protein